MTITHPFHPLSGQRVELMRIRRGGDDPDFVIRYPDGSYASIAMSATDRGAPPGPLPSSPLLLAPEALCQMRCLVDRMRNRDAPALANNPPVHTD